ncbi:MAG: hypothetical protein C0403_08625 [Desulfobacterium sp.]|nr:hypothetical protein [Desulfobacterium sp.]
MNGRNKTGLILIFGFGVLLLISLIPLGMVRFPPMVDYPNHLARMYLLANLDQSDILSEFYRIKWTVLPNLAMDVIVPPLIKIFPLEIAGRIFIAIILLLLLSGTCALFYALHRRISVWPLLAVLFLYNRVLLWGFLNCLFGIGLMLWVLAAWIFFSDRPAYVRAIGFIIPALCLFFSHIFALGVYGLCIVGYEFSAHRRSGFRNQATALGISLVQFILPGILFLFFSPAAPADQAGIYYGSFFWRFVAVLYPVLNYYPVLDIGTALMLGGLFVTGILTKKIHIAEAMYGPLVLLFILFWIMPMQIITSDRNEMRISITLAFLITAASAPEPGSIRHWRTGVALLLVLVGVRTAVLTTQWFRADEIYSQYLTAFEQIKPGGRLFTAIAYPGVWKPFPVPLTHIPCLAIIQRSAFVPSLLAYSTQQPVQLAEVYEKQKKQYHQHPNFENGEMPEIEKIFKNYDYFLIVNELYFRKKIDISWPEIYRGDNFRLLKVPASSEKGYSGGIRKPVFRTDQNWPPI